MARKNIYTHAINLTQLNIRNAPSAEFAEKVRGIEYRGYEVEQCADGKKIVITKPGGKWVYGQPKKEDILVFIFDPRDNTLWQISHQQILDDVKMKCDEDAEKGRTLIALLERTFHGEEPNDFIDEINALSFQSGEHPEELIKAYKWIWGQEDVNYPNGDGRNRSWNAYQELRETL